MVTWGSAISINHHMCWIFMSLGLDLLFFADYEWNMVQIANHLQQSQGGMEDRLYRTMMILRAYVTWGDGSPAKMDLKMNGSSRPKVSGWYLWIISCGEPPVSGQPQTISNYQLFIMPLSLRTMDWFKGTFSNRKPWISPLRSWGFPVKMFP